MGACRWLSGGPMRSLHVRWHMRHGNMPYPKRRAGRRVRWWQRRRRGTVRSFLAPIRLTSWCKETVTDVSRAPRALIADASLCLPFALLHLHVYLTARCAVTERSCLSAQKPLLTANTIRPPGDNGTLYPCRGGITAGTASVHGSTEPALAGCLSLSLLPESLTRPLQTGDDGEARAAPHYPGPEHTVT